MADSPADDERIDELNTLQSIYPELTFDARHPTGPSARIELPVAPVEPLPVLFSEVSREDGEDSESIVHRLSHLPPLVLEIVLAEGYPAERPPSLKLSTTPEWLPHTVLEGLEKEGQKLWEEYAGMQMLFAYISWLHESSETAFGLVDTSAKKTLRLPPDIKDELLSLNSKVEKEAFDKETFTCSFCLDPKKGSLCHRMANCGHVFCRSCLQDYYTSCIKEGDVDNVRCMDPDCGKTGDAREDRRKRERLLTPQELLQIPLDETTVTRYAHIKRKKLIEADPNIVFCPRTWCQGPQRSAKYPPITSVATMDSSLFWAGEDTSTPPSAPSDEEKRMLGAPHTDRLVVCELCTFAFCRVCLSSWHGEHARCILRTPKDLTEEERASLNYILQNTSPCPTCSVPCVKSYGCNHMTCFNCKSHFCYLCGAWLLPDSPYRHFNDPKNKACYQRLMDGAMGEEEAVRFGGRRGAEQEAEFWEREALRMQMEELDLQGETQ